MGKELINQSISADIPDRFRTMSPQELQQAFRNSDPNRWGTWDRENHVMITVLWKDYPLLLSKLAGLKDVCRKNEQLNSKGYSRNDYRFEGFFSSAVAGLPAEGYRFTYRIGDIKQSAETVLVKKGRTIYSITCAGRLENKTADQAAFAGILNGIRF